MLQRLSSGAVTTRALPYRAHGRRLIMGILMAIAIPTFLSTRGSANDASAKSNATNGFTNEKSYYATTRLSWPPTTTATGNTLDDSLPWGTPLGNVAAYTYFGQ